MKKWTVVIEITDESSKNDMMDRSIIESELSDHLCGAFFVDAKFQIMEIIEAPYGPQHPNGVFLDERHNTGRKRT